MVANGAVLIARAVVFASSIMDSSMLRINVVLASGHSETFSVLLSSTIADLRVIAQQSFRLGFLKLVAGDGSVLDPAKSLEAEGLQDGDTLTAIVQQVRLVSASATFAIFCCGGDQVVTWGDPISGGNSSEVQGQLRNVLQIQATRNAFAAILANGRVVTWGHPEFGGDSSQVQDQLTHVQQIQCTKSSEVTGGAFAAVLADGGVVIWGNPFEGGDCDHLNCN